MKKIDEQAINELEIPSLILMENAGRAVADEVLSKCYESEFANNGDFNVLVICGKGNNGGDGFVVARHLVENLVNVKVLSLFPENTLSGDALKNHNILKYFAEIIYFEEIEESCFVEMLKNSAILVDAIWGTGLNSEIQDQMYKIIHLINENGRNKVISIDIASGVDSATGAIKGIAVKADSTVTFCMPKLGSILYPGADYSGNIVLADIGIPQFLLNKEEYNINLIDENYVSSVLPERTQNSHKGSFGSVFNIAGSDEMSGAAYFASMASLKTGAGYSILATTKNVVFSVSSMVPELIYCKLQGVDDSVFTDLKLVQKKSNNSNCFLIGPGLSVKNAQLSFVKEFFLINEESQKSFVIDADALNCLVVLKNFKLPKNSVMTPHPKELSRLLNISVEQILQDRIYYAKLASQQFKAVVVLKGARSIIASPDGRIFVNTTGCSSLATAGTGDVLSGMIAGFLAQNVDLLDATILSVYLHGLAGELASECLTDYSTTASDILKYIPDAIKSLS